MAELLSPDEVPDHFPYKYEKDTFITCTCGSEGICVNELYGDGELILSFWKYGSNFHSMPLRMRLRYAWAALRGEPYVDEIILNKEQLDILIECLQERAKHIIEIQG